MGGRISNLAQVASVRRYTLSDGTEKGLDVLDCDNGKLRFLLNVSKACDVMQLYHEGQNVSFISKNGFTKRETPFLNRFEGGMLYTCGLDSFGDREGFPLHGSLHNIPAQIVYAVCDENGIAVEAIVRDTALFGKNLVLKRKIFSRLGEECLHLEDTLVNEGYTAEDYCLLYHVNIGYPMLDDGAVIEADVEKCVPRTLWAKENEKEKFAICAPIPAREETCYFLTLARPQISLVNPKLGKRFAFSYSGDTLPHFVEWKSMASGDYALGFEPCTSELDEGFFYNKLEAKAQVHFRIDMRIAKN